MKSSITVVVMDCWKSYTTAHCFNNIRESLDVGIQELWNCLWKNLWPGIMISSEGFPLISKVTRIVNMTWSIYGDDCADIAEEEEYDLCDSVQEEQSEADVSEVVRATDKSDEEEDVTTSQPPPHSETHNWDPADGEEPSRWSLASGPFKWTVTTSLEEPWRSFSSLIKRHTQICRTNDARYCYQFLQEYSLQYYPLPSPLASTSTIEATPSSSISRTHFPTTSPSAFSSSATPVGSLSSQYSSWEEFITTEVNLFPVVDDPVAVYVPPVESPSSHRDDDKKPLGCWLPLSNIITIVFDVFSIIG